MRSKTPTWAIITAVLIMLIGGCGIKNDIQSIKIREMIALKDKIFSAMDDENMKDVDTSLHSKTSLDSTTSEKPDKAVLEKDTVQEDTLANIGGKDKKDIKEVKKMIEDVFTISEKMISRFIIFGYVGLIFSVLLIIGGIFLLIKKPFSIKLIYTAIGANILFCLIRWIMLTSDEIKGVLKWATGLGSAFSIFILLIILVVIVSSDKSDYEEVYQD